MVRAGKKKKGPGKRGKIEKQFVPEEIITNILIWLPVKSLVRFQLVCKKWKDTISSRDFVDLHQRSSIPVILLAPLVASRYGYGSDLFALDKWWDYSPVLHRFPTFAPDLPNGFLSPFSHSGLIVLNASRFRDPEQSFIILINPARPNDECVRINYAKDFRGDICAVYYHPSLEEYCALWKISIPSTSGNEPGLIQYKLLNLGSDPAFKMISDAFTYRVRDIRIRNEYPLLIKDRLYWMLESAQPYSGHNDILEFDIITEEFRVIPCPIPLSTGCSCYNTRLLNSDGNLSFLLIVSSRVTVWFLKDRELQLWTTTEYTINGINFGACVIACVNGMLAYELQGKLFVCNLSDGTVKKYPEEYGDEVLFLSHQMSLASLKNCKDELYIDKNGKVSV